MKKSKKNIYYFIIAIVIILILEMVIIGFLKIKEKQNAPKIYVANEGDGTISVINQKTLEVVKSIHLDGMPHNVNVDPLKRYAYATNHQEEANHADAHGSEHKTHSPYLRIINAKKDKLIDSIPMYAQAAHVVPSKNGGLVYISIEGGNKIVEVDAEKKKIIRNLNAGDGPHGFVLSNDGKTIYAPNMRSNNISIVDIRTGKDEKIKIEIEDNKCETPVAMGITSDDKYSFVTCGKSFEVYKIDNTAKKAIAVIKLKKGEHPGPIQIPVHPEGKLLYIPDMRNGVVHKISIEPFTLIKDIPTGAGSHGIAYSSNGKYAYVTNTWENNLAVIDLENNYVIKKIKVGEKPNGVAVSEGKNQGW